MHVSLSRGEGGGGRRHNKCMSRRGFTYCPRGGGGGGNVCNYCHS